MAIPGLVAAYATSSETVDPNQHYGKLVDIGNGTARTYVTWTDADDGTQSLNAIGIELPAHSKDCPAS